MAHPQLSHACAREAAAARANNWPVCNLDSHQLAPFTDPAEVAAAMLALFEDTQPASR